MTYSDGYFLKKQICSMRFHAIWFKICQWPMKPDPFISHFFENQRAVRFVCRECPTGEVNSSLPTRSKESFEAHCRPIGHNNNEIQSARTKMSLLQGESDNRATDRRWQAESHVWLNRFEVPGWNNQMLNSIFEKQFVRSVAHNAKEPLNRAQFKTLP